jgi:deazaflavin-dependent oxidoreductase (nitroreductase family)
VKATGPVGRVVQRVAGSSGFRRFAPTVLPPIDKFINKITGGRVLIAAALLPSLVLTTTGAKSGQPRSAPLACLTQDDGSFLIVGSNFGQEHHPAWTGNLIKTPEATVQYQRRTFPVTAHLLTDAEKADVWPELTRAWPTFDRYVEVSGRNLRVFRLTPA